MLMVDFVEITAAGDVPKQRLWQKGRSISWYVITYCTCTNWISINTCIFQVQASQSLVQICCSLSVDWYCSCLWIWISLSDTCDFSCTESPLPLMDPQGSGDGALAQHSILYPKPIHPNSGSEIEIELCEEDHIVKDDSSTADSMDVRVFPL